MTGGILRRLVRAREGATAVEFALISPVFFMFVYGLWEVGQTLYLQHTLSRAASQTVRMIYVDPEMSDSQIKEKALAFAKEADGGGLSAELATQVEQGVTFTELTISYPHKILIPMVGTYDVSLEGSARLPAVSDWADG